MLDIGEGKDESNENSVFTVGRWAFMIISEN
jgi:hypothetical protein